MKYAIEVQNLTKRYGSYKAVDNLSLKVPEGKIYGFLGKNGAGKTTTIRMIMRLIKPESGRILLFGRDIREDRKWAALNIGGIVETPGFYENLTARENLELTAAMYGCSSEGVDRLLDMVQLSEAGNKKSKNFSLGMKQRLGIANSLVHSPKVLILDEPANGLDPAGIRDMRSFLRDISENHGITVMVSSHLLSEVQQIADYVGIIDRGSLVEETDIKSINEGNQSFLLLEVDKKDRAVEELKRMQLVYEVEQQHIRVFCSREMNSHINRNLVRQDINVYNLSSVSQSLEERFLEITGERPA